MEAIKTRIYPTEKQAELIEKTFGCARFVYNKLLETQIRNHEQGEKFINKYGMTAWIVSMKKEYEWLKEVDSHALQKEAFNLESAYKKFFKEHTGFPKFKSKHKDRQSYRTDSWISIGKHWVKVPKMDKLRVYEALPEVSPRQITISKEAGKYFVSILFDGDNKKKSGNGKIGIDLGIKDFAVLSNGEKIANPKFFKNSEKRLAVLQRRASRKQKGSNRSKEARLKVSQCHMHIRNQRQDFIHKLTTAIAKRYEHIAIEDLSVNNMVKNRHLSKAISDVGWYEFRRQLEYKVEWYGGRLVVIGRFDPSSKTCSECGNVQTLTLDQREWTCNVCGAEHDRDINAAKNILKFSISPKELRVGGVEPLTVVKAKKRQCRS